MRINNSSLFFNLRSRFHGTLPEIEADNRELIGRLRSVPGSSLVIHELWIYSRYGTWRYFRVGDTGIEETSMEGLPVKNKGEEPVTAAGKVTAAGAGMTPVTHGQALRIRDFSTLFF